MLEHLTLGEFAVAALMAVAALCAFVWGAATGAFGNVEGVKHDVLRAEGVPPPPVSTAAGGDGRDG